MFRFFGKITTKKESSKMLKPAKGFFIFKKTISGVVIASLVLSLVLPGILFPVEVKAQGNGVPIVWQIGKKALDSIKKFTKQTKNKVQKGFKGELKGDEAINEKNIANEERQNVLRNSVVTAAAEGFSHLLNSFAYDLASWLASGGEGQGTMFFNKSFSEYLTDTLDASAGQFLETFGEGLGGLNLCELSPSLKVRIGLGLAETSRPSAPNCSFTEALDNWQNVSLEDFSYVFDPEYNDIGIAFSVFEKSWQKKYSETEAAEKNREEGDGFRSVGERIASGMLNDGPIKTPATTVKEAASQLVKTETGSDGEKSKVQYGNIFYIAIATFVDTLLGKLFEKVLKEGLASGSGDDDDDWYNLLGMIPSVSIPNSAAPESDLYSGQSGTAAYSGKDAAELRFLDFLTTSQKNRGTAYDILTELVTCPDPENPGPNECVINDRMRIAIERKMTLKEAVAKKYINGEAPFGFMDYDANALERGIPYRTITILRAYRVVPVGWELAAQIANTNHKGKIYSLNDLMNLFDSDSYSSPKEAQFKGLVDPNWVLKAPQHFCTDYGYGPKIVYDDLVDGEDSNEDGDYLDAEDVPASRLVARAEYCADYESCIELNDDGSCKYYGYCNEDRRIWDLQGSNCPEQFASCKIFSGPGNQVVSYLSNSLDYNGCNIDNAGCAWYCNDYNPFNDIWTCVNEKENILKPCTVVSGCSVSANCAIEESEYSCFDENSQVNLYLTTACNANSQWWDDDSKTCIVGDGCIIKNNEVACVTDSCADYENFIDDNSFELAPTVYSDLSRDWLGDLDYFERVSGSTEKVYPDGGRYSIRFFNSGTSITTDITNKVPYNLNPGTYRFSGWIYSNLNAGKVRVEVLDDTTVIEEKEFDIDTRNEWQPVITPDFTGTNQINIRIIFEPVNPGSPVSGVAWIDNLRLSESCASTPATLTLVGDLEKDQSKLHLDRDANTCDANEAGCSEFIRLQPNNGTNLIKNSSFENWPSTDETPIGWQMGEAHSNEPDTNVERITEDCPLGNICLKINDGDSIDLGTARDFETENIIGIKPETTYRVSFWAKSDMDTQDQWYVEFLHQNNPDSYCSMNVSKDCSGHEFEYAVGTGSFCDDGEQCIGDWQKILFNGSRFLKLTYEWKRFVSETVVTRRADLGIKLSFDNRKGGGANNRPIYIDGIQVEEVSSTNPAYSNYSEYGENNLVYLEKPPTYLGCNGYTETRLPENPIPGIDTEDECQGETLVWRNGGCYTIDPAECFNYAPVCHEDEVGCELYTPIVGGQSIPGVTVLQDYCPAECVGYEAYKQSPTVFESQEELNYFIPSTALQCNAGGIGCTEFTNLDEVAKGGEGIQYYKYLRQCVKPLETGVSCSNFYTWEGSDDTGFQLRLYNLQENTTNELENPLGSPAEAIEYDSDTPPVGVWPEYWCNNMYDNNGDDRPDCCDGPEDLETNLFCKEFYSEDGEIYYRIYDNTIVCSDDCYPLRKTRFGEPDALAQQNCTDTNGRWDSSSSACIYNAVPDESILCSEADANCREYKGNNSGNVFVAFWEDFELGSSNKFHFGEISSEALTVGGHSIKAEHTADSIGNYNYRVVTTWGQLNPSGTECSESLPECSDSVTVDCYDRSLNKCIGDDYNVGDSECLIDIGEQFCGLMDNIFIPNKTYILSFWAKKAENAESTASLEIQASSAVDGARVGQVEIDSDWKYYVVGPFNTFSDYIRDGSRIRFLGPDTTNSDPDAVPSFYIDNIQLKQVSNYVYVGKNSWKTPESCDTNPWFIEGPVPAPQYMLGCASYFDSYGRNHNLKSFDNLCREEAVGCEALIDTFNSSSPFAENFNVDDPYADVKVPADDVTYLANRPDYQCGSLSKGCTAVGVPIMQSTSLGDKVVSYLNAYVINNPDQYNSTLCSSEEVGCQEWQSGDGYYYFKDPGTKTCEYRLVSGSIGSGGFSWGWFIKGSSSTVPDCPMIQPSVGAAHPDPGKGFTGICPGEFNSCTLFVDPVTFDGKNLLYNADLERDTVLGGDCGAPDGWYVDTCDEGPNHEFRDNITQEVTLKANTLYTLGVTTGGDFSANVGDFWFMLSDCQGVTSYDNSMIEANSYCVDAQGRQTDDFKSDGTPGSDGRRDLCNEATGYCQGDGNTTRSCSIPNWIMLPSYKEDDRNSSRFSGFPDDRTGIDYSARFMVPVEQNCKLTVMMEENATASTTDAIEILGCNVNTYENNLGECDPVIDNYIKGLVDEISLVETGTYTVLENSVDKMSCNGVVNIQNYCVPFNNRSKVNYKIGENDTSYLYFDADVSDIFINGGIPVSDCAGVCDSNVVLSVRPDRVCDNWLYCESYAEKVDENGNVRNVCLSLGSCSSLDENGNCNDPDPKTFWTEGDPLVVTDYYEEPEHIKNLTGYNVAGLNLGDGEIVYGYLPFQNMEQEGNSGKLTNGNFESIFTSGRDPLGWSEYTFPDTCSDGRGWMPYKFISQVNPEQAFEGSFLQLNTSYDIKSSGVDIEKGDYYLTGWVNTTALKNDESKDEIGAKICYLVCDSTGSACLQEEPICEDDLKIPAGKDWTYFNHKIKINNSGILYIILSNYIEDDDGNSLDLNCRDCIGKCEIGGSSCKSDDDCLPTVSCIDKVEDKTTSCNISGYSMFDELKLNPILTVSKHYEQGNDANIITDFKERTCRQYPEADSLGCEYYKENVFIKGQYGYCLTADPVNRNQCIQWWPIDMILGDFEEEEMLYQIQSPLYYCVEKDEKAVFNDDNKLLGQFNTLPSSFSIDMNDQNGYAADMVEFEFPDDYRPMIRYPYISRVKMEYDFNPHYNFITTNNKELAAHLYAPFDANFNASGFQDQLQGMLSNLPLIGLFGGIFDFNGFNFVTDSLINPLSTFESEIMDRINPLITINNETFLDISTKDSEKFGLLPITYFNRIDLPFFITLGIAIIAIAITKNIELVIAGFGTVYEMLAGALPFQYVGFYLHGVLGFNDFLVSTNVAPLAATTLSSAINLTGSIPNMLVSLMSVFSGFFGIFQSDFDLDAISTVMDGLSNAGEDLVTAQQIQGWWGVAFGPYSVVQPITDQDDLAHYAQLYDPVEDLPADVLGAAVSIYSNATDGGGSGAKGSFLASGLDVEYCKKIVKVVNEDGSNKAWTSRVFPGSEFVLNEPDPARSRKNYFLYYDPFEYEEFSQAIDECKGDCVIIPPFTSGWCNYAILPSLNISCKSDGDCALHPECNKYQSSDYSPFGSIVPPSNAQFPPNWDSRESGYLQPLFYEPPLTSLADPYQTRMGENHSIESLQRIFLRNYGVWDWDIGDPDKEADDSYIEYKGAGYSWDVLADWANEPEQDSYCDNNIRPLHAKPGNDLNDNELCRVRPEVSDIVINGEAYRKNDEPVIIGSPVTIIGNGQIKLDFTAKVDGNQLPIVSYAVDWGDGTKASTSGLSLRDRPNIDNPFTLFHFYDFWQLQQCAANPACGSSVTCTADECNVKIGIKIKDNWGAETCNLENTTDVGCNDEANKYISSVNIITVESPVLY